MANPDKKAKPAIKNKIKVEKSDKKRLILAPIKQENNIEDDGVSRRSKRTRIEPLAYWKNEKIIYGRRDSGISPISTIIQDVIRIDSDDEAIPVRRANKSSKKVAVKKERKEEYEVQPPIPEDVLVINYLTKEEEYQSIFY